jgi:hypothetical protein
VSCPERGAEHDAGPVGGGAPKIRQPDSRARLEGLPIDERRVHVFVARQGIDVVPGQVYDRSGLAQFVLQLPRIIQHVVAEGVTVVGWHRAGHRNSLGS